MRIDSIGRCARLSYVWVKPAYFRLSVDVVTNVALSVLKIVPLVKQGGFFLKAWSVFQEVVAGTRSSDELKVERVFWQALSTAFLVAAGVCGVWSEYEWLIHSAQTAFGKELFYWNNGFFLFSSIIGLKLSVDSYREAEGILAKEERERQQYRTILEICMHLSFISGSLLFLTGSASFVALALCMLGSTLSLFQILVDYYN